MKLGVSLGYWGGQPPRGLNEMVAGAIEHGYE